MAGYLNHSETTVDNAMADFLYIEAAILVSQ